MVVIAVGRLHLRSCKTVMDGEYLDLSRCFEYQWTVSTPRKCASTVREKSPDSRKDLREEVYQCYHVSQIWWFLKAISMDIECVKCDLS